MRFVEFDLKAAAELEVAGTYYRTTSQESEGRFRAQVLAALARIRRFPELGSVGPCRGTRRLKVLRYPYEIVYLVESDRIFIVAIAHQKRRPDYWADRVRETAVWAAA